MRGCQLMPTPQDLTGVTWRKSSRSKDADTCVEVTTNLADIVGVRDSTCPDGPKLMFDRAAFVHMVSKIRAGDHDL